MTAIYLIRHGATNESKRRVYYGATDVPVSREGMEALAALKAQGIYPPARRLITSGLSRTKQTASLIYPGMAQEVMEGLNEFNFGEFELYTHEQLMNDQRYVCWISDETAQTSCPGGESAVQFQGRVLNAFAEIKKTPCETAVVCHGGVIATIMQALFASEEKNFYQWLPDFGHGYALERADGKWRSRAI